MIFGCYYIYFVNENNRIIKYERYLRGKTRFNKDLD